MITTRTPPMRLQILIGLQELLAQISTLDGDAFSLNLDHVLRNRVLLGEDVTADGPTLAIIEAPRPDFAQFAGEDNVMRKDHWTLLIQGIAPDDRMDTTDDIYYLCQDVERRLQRMSEQKSSGSPAFPGDYMLGGKITSVEIAPPVIRPPEAQVSRFSYFYLPIRFGVAVEIGE